MTRPLTLLALLAATAPRTPAQDFVGPSWTPLSFTVTKSPPGGNPARDFDQGVRVVARLGLPGQQVVAVDSTKSEVKSFTDDRDTDLLAVPAGRRLVFRAVSGDRVLPDDQPNDVTFRAPGLPAKGATKVRLKGTVVVVVGKDEKEVERKDADLKKGVELPFGTVKALDRKEFVEVPGLPRTTYLTYEGTRPLVSVALLDGDGKEVPCRLMPRLGPAGLGNQAPHRAGIFATGASLERGTLRVKYYDTVEEVKVPFDIEVGPGL